MNVHAVNDVLVIDYQQRCNVVSNLDLDVFISNYVDKNKLLPDIRILLASIQHFHKFHENKNNVNTNIFEVLFNCLVRTILDSEKKYERAIALDLLCRLFDARPHLRTHVDLKHISRLMSPNIYQSKELLFALTMNCMQQFC